MKPVIVLLLVVCLFLTSFSVYSPYCTVEVLNQQSEYAVGEDYTHIYDIRTYNFIAGNYTFVVTRTGGGLAPPFQQFRLIAIKKKIHRILIKDSFLVTAALNRGHMIAVYFYNGTTPIQCSAPVHILSYHKYYMPNIVP